MYDNFDKLQLAKPLQKHRTYGEGTSVFPLFSDCHKSYFK